MKLTLQIRLMPNEGQIGSLKETMKTFNEACNVISQIAWERRVFSQFSIHKEVYHAIKATYHLSAQLVIRAISKVADAYKLDRKKMRKFREFGSVTYDSRILSYTRSNMVSICLLSGREKIPYVCHCPELMQYAKGEADLVFIREKFFLLQTIDIPEEEEESVEEFIGIDMGVTDIACTSDGQTLSSSEINRIRNKYNRTRASVQSKGTRNCHKLLKRLKGREHRFVSITNHTISKQLVEQAKSEHKGIAIEDLTNIRKGSNKQRKAKDTKRKINSWSFYQLRSFLTYKCKRSGVKLAVIPPAYTSQTCSQCLHIGNRNGKHFHCNNCGHIADADINAACNISTWGFVNTHEKWDMLSCSLHDNLSTFKAHHL